MSGGARPPRGDGGLRQVAADIRALVEAEVARGFRGFRDDLALPDVAVDEGEEEEEPVHADAAPVEEAPPLPPASPDRGWAAAADAARAAAVPVWSAAPVIAATGADALATVREDLGDCRRCRLCEGRRSIVFGVGDPDADLMVVGEGPGEQEDLRGEPFVGPAGEMLDRMLENVVGLPRSKVYIANIVKCRPPGNRNPGVDEAAACLPFLHRQIRAVQPKVLLVLGSVAMLHLLGETGITKKRGVETRWEGICTLPTFHPAYLLRVPDDKRKVFEDLKLLRRRYDELGGRR